MRILFDQGTPVPLRRNLRPHRVDTAAELGWSRLENGALLEAAEAELYEVLITTDQNLRYQQNLADRKIGILVLKTTSWPRIQHRVEEVLRAVDSLPIGGYVELDL